MSVSIIVPIYKGNKYIPKLVDTIQKWSDLSNGIQLEIIFINDFPQEPIILSHRDNQYKVSIQVLNNQRNMGIHYSRVVGAQYAAGEYLVFLDQDDTLNKFYLISQLQDLKDGEAVICNGLYRHGEKIFSISNPMKREYSFQVYLENGYPLVSLGQLLIRKNSLPQEWFANIMIHNGWDDHFLWALLMRHGVKINSNEDTLYVHEEDGNNASFNWKNMSLSGREFRDIFLKLNLMDITQEKQFRYIIDSKISKYDDYAELETLLNKISSIELKEYFNTRAISNISIYGFGVYGKLFYNSIGDSGLKVKYCIDRRSDNKNAAIPVILLHDNMPKVDAIIVSPVSSFNEIEKEIRKYCSFKVLSLLNILREIDNPTI
jgi:glycosyltransferase involved in cell wall biosynthesis